MKSRFLIFFMSLFIANATAQNPYIALEGLQQSESGMTISQPRTVLAVDICVENSVIIAGPYARYAQKFLGVRAPLSNKSVWSVVSATVSLLDSDTYLNAAPLPESSVSYGVHAEDSAEFTRLQADKMSIAPTTDAESAAKKAAEQIFFLRRNRVELITAQVGENVFGAGLKAALDEIDKLEQSYLELFMGKSIVTKHTQRNVIYPTKDKLRYVVCRFSATAGLVPDSDLSGDMVLLQIEPSVVSVAELQASIKERNLVSCRVASPATCTVILAGREYAKSVLPIFEFGESVKVAVPYSR